MNVNKLFYGTAVACAVALVVMFLAIGAMTYSINKVQERIACYHEKHSLEACPKPDWIERLVRQVYELTKRADGVTL